MLYDSGKLEEAAQKYEALLSNKPDMAHARAGLMRVRLQQQRIEAAYELGKTGLALPGFTAELLTAMGDVEFRRGEMGEAEGHYQHAKKMDRTEVSAYLGLLRLYRSYSLRRKAYDQLKAAHDISPDDAEVQREWFLMLPRNQRLRAIEDYLSLPHPKGDVNTLRMVHSAEHVKAALSKPAHACKLVNKVEKAQTPLLPLMSDLNHERGFGLQVKLNDHTSKLMLDTGASGITVGRHTAERAGLERIAETKFGGIGDKGAQSGYSAVARRIRIGELEFEDCTVDVSDRASIDGDDGLIGTDVFDSYLIDIDGPALKLKLSPLPRRPDGRTAATALRTEVADAEGDDESGAQGSKKVEMKLPEDRYIAPEMATWTKVFRFGHQLLIPTRVNDSQSMLFVIDTGSNSNMISTTAAHRVTKISRDNDITVKGLNGTVKNVYSAYKVKLHFSHFAQENQDVVSLDLSNLSKNEGTEVSGLLGFELLKLLEMKIDYRDGLVDFSYDPKRIGSFRH